jgi:hypothetical protein
MEIKQYDVGPLSPNPTPKINHHRSGDRKINDDY